MGLYYNDESKACYSAVDGKLDSVSALERQVGGNHYKHYKIQPYEFFLANQTPHHKAAIIRRILRYDHPTGKGLEDLQKIIHEVELIIELEGWGKEEVDGKEGNP